MNAPLVFPAAAGGTAISMSRTVNTNAYQPAPTAISAFGYDLPVGSPGVTGTFSPITSDESGGWSPFWTDANISLSTSPVAYEFCLKNLGQLAPLPGTGNNPADPLDPANYTTEHLYQSPPGIKNATDLFHIADNAGETTVVQRQSMKRLSGAKGTETSFIYATLRMPKWSISLEFYNKLTKTNFSLDPYIIWYGLILEFHADAVHPPTVANPDIATPMTVAVFDVSHNKILQKNGTQWKERPLPPATEWTALSPGDPFQALMENQPLTLVIVNPLYYETLHIPPNFMKEISPLIKKVEDS